MSAESTIEKILAHYGVPGMKWGVRRQLNPGSGEGNSGGHDPNLSSRQRKKDDKWRYKVNLDGPGNLKQRTKFADKAAFDAINKKPEYKDLDFTKPSPELTKYKSEINAVWAKAMTDYVAKTHGATNPSKTKRMEWTWNENTQTYSSKMVPVTVKHADEFEPTTFLLNDEDGYIVGFVFGEAAVEHSSLEFEDFMAHYGIPGMRWGVRKGDPSGGFGLTSRGQEKLPVPVSVTQKKPGTRVKTSGGTRQPASDDAKKAAAARQKAKSSTTDALSNKELQELVQRMQLEANYSRLSATQKSAGKRFIESLFKDKNTREKTLDAATKTLDVVTSPLQVGDAIKRTDLSGIGK